MVSRALLRRVAAAGLLLACSPAERGEAGSSDPVHVEKGQDTMREHGWSEVVEGLQIRAELPPGPHHAGDSLLVTLHFRNVGSEPRRIYLLQSEPFRAMQSSFSLLRGEGPPDIQPEPRPHGVVVGEHDFPELPAKGARSFTQTLVLPRDLSPGPLGVEWTYENRIERWQGGVQTLDGPTQALFGGERIPGIWLGELSVRFEVVVE